MCVIRNCTCSIALRLAISVGVIFLAPAALSQVLQQVAAQSPAALSTSLAATQESDNSSAGPLLGGGGGADFTELMTLIQQTIDPDAWIDASSVMTPFPSGVSIDPAGQLKQIDFAETAIDLATPHRSGVRQLWRTTSPLRVVSLRQLDRAISRLAAAGLPTSPEHRLLAGLSRIEFVYVDRAGEDVLLAGPADGSRSPALQGFQLDDLGLLVELINARTSPLGCSIDPTDDGILAAQQLLQPRSAAKRLAIDPEKFAGQMQSAIGPHHVRVFGMPTGSPAALALVAADEHMKQIGFGTAHTAVSIENYFEHLDRQSDVPAQSLIRWWFAYAQEPILCDTARDIFQLPEQCVALLSEQQWVSLLGRKATGQQDAAADGFAAGMTAGLPELRRSHPAYARLCALYEFALALQLATEATGQPSLQAWFPHLTAIGKSTAGHVREPQTVSGLTAWHRLQQGTVVAVVSGGVQINARSAARPSAWRSKVLPVELPTSSAKNHSSHAPWWWD